MTNSTVFMTELRKERRTLFSSVCLKATPHIAGCVVAQSDFSSDCTEMTLYLFARAA